jgi:fucose 4-O-acetylase-like acetyltransferase
MPATLTRLPADSPAQASTSASRRDPWFDNAKMLLVVLVVVGHSWTLLDGSFGNSWAYNFLYLWHVPAFVMVTGYLSRSFTFSRRHLSRLATTVVVPYLVFELALTTYRSVVGGEHHGPLFLNPHWPMWYLAVLFVWRLATPVLKRLPHALPVAVAVSLVGGAFTGDTLDLARATGLLPFFVVGLLATPEQLAALRRPATRVTALLALGAAAVAATAIESTLGSEWLYWRSSYHELGVPVVGGVAMRLLLLAVCGGLAVAFLALVPGRGGWFSRLGSASLVVYLWHGFFVKSAQYTAFPAWAERHDGAALLLTTVTAVLLALLLASSPVSGRLGLLVDPVGAWRSRQAASSTLSGSPTPSGAAARAGAHGGGTALRGTL